MNLHDFLRKWLRPNAESAIAEFERDLNSLTDFDYAIEEIEKRLPVEPLPE